MKRIFKTLVTAMTLTVAATGVAMATPSTQIWIPSTDVQGFGTYHLGIDNYIRATKNNPTPTTRESNTYDIGPVAGFLPFEKLQGEIGFDYLSNATDANDNHPWSGNIKIGTPEDSLFKYSPAIAIGGYNLGPAQSIGLAPGVSSGQNIIYGLLAKTLPAAGGIPSLGRLSVGYYRGAERALRDADGTSSNKGVLASWDRTMTEISDKLWFGVDYLSGNNANGELGIGGSWAFSKQVTLLVGVQTFNPGYKLSTADGNALPGGKPAFTTQLFINLP